MECKVEVTGNIRKFSATQEQNKASFKGFFTPVMLVTEMTVVEHKHPLWRDESLSKRMFND